ncbi:MAG: hypothetical protein WC876_05615 [Candidatus Thermoplasmatota archaeon]|jgi:hypothetical protein
MASERRLVASALDDSLGMARWRWLGRRARMSRLYFQLRADGVGWRRAHTLVRRSRKALRELRKEPKGRAVALDLILA